MKYSANQGSISNFVVGGTESEYGPPVAVYMKKASSKATSAEPPPDGQ
ncbi:hypothetical protein [Desulfocicer vacuolatum]|nr:hypothetical protein [Desulfocicer vacuolatum]